MNDDKDKDDAHYDHDVRPTWSIGIMARCCSGGMPAIMGLLAMRDSKSCGLEASIDEIIAPMGFA